MLTFLIGMMGGLLIVLIFVFGVVFGSVFIAKPAKTETESLTDKQRKTLEEQQEAFQSMLHYNINDAYGIGTVTGGDA